MLCNNIYFISLILVIFEFFMVPQPENSMYFTRKWFISVNSQTILPSTVSVYHWQYRTAIDSIVPPLTVSPCHCQYCTAIVSVLFSLKLLRRQYSAPFLSTTLHSSPLSSSVLSSRPYSRFFTYTLFFLSTKSQGLLSAVVTTYFVSYNCENIDDSLNWMLKICYTFFILLSVVFFLNYLHCITYHSNIFK